jgi:glycosyltransferase involved in cell wall biosynthesis
MDNPQSFTLSYIIVTRNRLSFLKFTLKRLIAELQTDEEIVVVDGDSTDGTQLYLQQLFDSGKIHRFISEPDYNQAHGWNKAMLMARGTIIKKIIDDDVYCYEAIRKCKTYMLQNPLVDVVISNDLSSQLQHYTVVHKHSRLSQFNSWKNSLIPSFTFGDVHILIRRSSLAYIGLYNPSFTMMDWEYSLRISYLKANIVYYTGYNALTVGHPQTISSLVNKKTIAEQGKRGSFFYEYAGDGSEISYWSRLKIFAGNFIYKIKGSEPLALVNEKDIIETYNYYYNYIAECNTLITFSFI